MDTIMVSEDELQGLYNDTEYSVYDKAARLEEEFRFLNLLNPEVFYYIWIRSTRI